jgi:rare lipoprotein A
MIATIYADFFEGRVTSGGEIFRHSEMTAAHRTLPRGTRLAVSRGHRTIVVRVNDYCPKKGVLDLTKTAARLLALPGMGKVRVRRIQ